MAVDPTSGNGQRSPGPNRRGPRSRLTQERIDQAANYLRLGMYQEQAAILAGIPKSTWYWWLAKARELAECRDDPDLPNPKDPHELLLLELLDSSEKAMAEGEAVLLRRIYDAADPEVGNTWQAAAWILERSRPARWSRTDRHEFTGPGGGPIVRVEVEPDDVDRLDAITAALAEAGVFDDPPEAS